MKKGLILATIGLTLAMGVTAFAGSAVGISNVEYRSADEILTMYHKLGLDKEMPISYEVTPNLSSFETSGSLSEEVEQNALNTVNFARYIAGLSYDVELNDSYSQNSQNAAHALAIVGDGIAHSMDKQTGMSDSMYESVSLGLKKGNLSAGISSLDINVIHGWLSDEGDGNQYALGHRRYILADEMTGTGFGFVNANSSAQYNTYSVMSTEGVGFGGDAVGVVWPAQTMPVEYFGDNYPWSYTYGSNVGTNVEVTITRTNDGKTWTMKDDFINGSTGDGFICVNNDYYGQIGCVIFEPDNISYSAGDVYNVKISSGTVNASYTVTFISLSDSYVEQSTGSVEVEEEVVVEEETTTATTDVSGASTWAQNELNAAIEAGFPVNVYADKYTQDMTRGEFAHMLGLFCDNKWKMTDDYSTTDFTDLGSDAANAERNKYIIILNKWGVINGTTDTTYEPDETITREAIATLLLNVKELYLNVNITQDISGYADASSVSSWALDGVRYMNEIGVLSGTTDNKLNPQGNITVEQAALMCYRFFK